MKRHSLPLLFLTIAGTMRAQAPFTVSLVPSRSTSSERGITTAASRPDMFYVIVTNVSEQPHAVWAVSNSWGYR